MVMTAFLVSVMLRGSCGAIGGIRFASVRIRLKAKAVH
jgi:hypothetical protein